VRLGYYKEKPRHVGGPSSPSHPVVAGKSR